MYIRTLLYWASTTFHKGRIDIVSLRMFIRQSKESQLKSGASYRGATPRIASCNFEAAAERAHAHAQTVPPRELSTHTGLHTADKGSVSAADSETGIGMLPGRFPTTRSVSDRTLGRGLFACVYAYVVELVWAAPKNRSTWLTVLDTYMRLMYMLLSCYYLYMQ